MGLVHDQIARLEARAALWARLGFGADAERCRQNARHLASMLRGAT